MSRSPLGLSALEWSSSSAQLKERQGDVSLEVLGESDVNSCWELVDSEQDEERLENKDNMEATVIQTSCILFLSLSCG